MPVVYIGIGSNIGERAKYCATAVELLERSGMHIICRSGMIETRPWGMPDQPEFINLAVGAETDLSPRALLVLLKRIETDMGRTQEVKWGPRIIDLDILLYDDLQVNETALTVPHPLMHERDFVLRPLTEIAPNMLHPVLKKTVKQLLIKLEEIDQLQ